MNNYYPPYYSYPSYYQQNSLFRSNSGFNIPFLPIVGDQSFTKLTDDILKSIVDEATAAHFYARLLKQAPDSLHKAFIEHAYEDELKHLQAFTKLYVHLTNHHPQYEIQQIQFSTYKDGILKALKAELEAAEFYRDVKLSSPDPLVKDTFFYAMVDELEHSTQFGVLYNSL
ncbi:ferritin-like domain-containing protein [Aquibacillus albus]|uniref:Rubrerythrin n=1 Tax=Aquibacillus albus TaxID=1168171 RepID=A0ABS2MYB5_9BACI|nr:ferritin-like domain-containing protein [Aquibacillus albus]MBM7570889.1 rubrerythrin [Aquibacillus albus]